MIIRVIVNCNSEIYTTLVIQCVYSNTKLWISACKGYQFGTTNGSAPSLGEEPPSNPSINEVNGLGDKGYKYK